MSDGSAAPERDIRAELRLELESLRAEFHELLDSLSAEMLADLSSARATQHGVRTAVPIPPLPT